MPRLVELLEELVSIGKIIFDLRESSQEEHEKKELFEQLFMHLYLLQIDLVNTLNSDNPKKCQQEFIEWFRTFSISEIEQAPASQAFTLSLALKTLEQNNQIDEILDHYIDTIEADYRNAPQQKKSKKLKKLYG